jgi:uncharacterized protein DUF3303
MLFMVIERFSDEKRIAMADRFRWHGRLLPNGVVYQASWIDETGSRCYQVMQAESRALLDEWIARWSDLVDFEVVPVMTSAEFWEKRANQQLGRTDAHT